MAPREMTEDDLEAVLEAMAVQEIDSLRALAAHLANDRIFPHLAKWTDHKNRTSAPSPSDTPAKPLEAAPDRL